MMNKGLEVIEAHWLFGVTPAAISILLVSLRRGALDASRKIA